MSPEEIRGWAAIILAAMTALAVAIIGGRAAWKNSRRSAEELQEARHEPSWTDLVTENRNLRAEFASLDKKFDDYRDEQRKARKEQLDRIERLEVDRSLADRREVLIYHHTKALRDHIINELPPPPPAMPKELIDWFENFEDTQPAL